MSLRTKDVKVSQEWIDCLMTELHELRLWLTNPSNIDDILEDLADTLVEKHHDYGEDNLVEFGELGVLVRANDKVARLKNLVLKPGAVKDESREDNWRDLAGYAVQALIMMKRETKTPKVDIFNLRKYRLIRGLCPDCGKGALLRRQQWGELLTANLFCSDGCGFDADLDPFDMQHDTTETIHKLAGIDAIEEQVL